ncbi:MAG: DUF58 domain-containing protein [bacterium]|nr:DUF58 domain-containing protein [Candidatus Kapabacteria bacterium]
MTPRFFYFLAAIAFVFVVGFLFPPIALIARIGVGVLALLVIADLVMLYRGGSIDASRQMEDRLSNGDENEIRLTLTNHYRFDIHARVLDELPVQLQVRDLDLATTIPPESAAEARYSVRPVTRGEYSFGVINVLASGPIGLAQRRFRAGAGHVVPVYPSYIQMRKYELLAISNRLVEVGVKRVRRVGSTMEFDQIREYVSGDDYRTVNWRATARRNTFMVNQYMDERSQQVFCVIDKGRAMKMPFAGMTLLDYAINTSLVIANIAIHKQDRAGLVTFGKRIDTYIAPDRRRLQMRRIVEALYHQKTEFLESDFEALYAHVRHSITTRSLLLVFTNFETLSGMERRLKSRRAKARQHHRVVVFFENTELRQLLDTPASSTEQIYLKAIAEKLALEKKQIVKELSIHGIHSILTAPENLTVDTINKYLELKSRRMI